MATIPFVVYNRGKHFVPAALKIFNAEVNPQLLYSIQIWISTLDWSLERVQAKLLWKILGMPYCVPYVLCLETGQNLIETRAWLMAI